MANTGENSAAVVGGSGDQVWSGLASARILICGIGGLGSWVAELLVRNGVGLRAAGGFIRIIDPDVFEESNLNRQLFATVDALGMPKVDIAAQRLAAVNPAVAIEPVRQSLTSDNAQALLAGCSIAVDASDNARTRFVLEDAADRAGIRLVHGAVGGLFGQMAVIWPGDRLLHRLYDGTAPASKPTTAPVVACVASHMAQACVLLLGGSQAEDNLSCLPPRNTLLTFDMGRLDKPTRIVPV